VTAAVHATDTSNPANLAPTPILDHEHPRVRAIADSLAAGAPRSRLREAHRRLQAAVRPVYTLDELQPASVTLAKARGSCSQRIACLEAVARADGVPTRVRALLVSGRFWYPRFGRLLRPFLPRRILLAWPQFHLDGAWTDLDELFGDAASLVSSAREGFTNDGETLFEAIGHTSVDFLHKTTTCGAACSATFDLSKHVLADEGFFDSRDALFASRLLLQHTLSGRVFEAFWGGRESTRGRQSGAAVLPEVTDGGRRCSGG